MRKIKFGGPNLREGQHTWFELETDQTGGAKVIQAYPGETHDVPNADYYVKAGMASYVEAEAPVPVSGD